MKVLIVNSTDVSGGAARAAYRLHQALLTQNINSQMLVQSRVSNDYRVFTVPSKLQIGLSKFRAALDSLPVKAYKFRTNTLFSPSYLPFGDVVKQINVINPDIVHLHWVNGGMMRIEDMVNIKAPIVWTLHDMWAFTGGCHYDEECGAYQKSCGECKVLGSNRQNDLSRKVFHRKSKSYVKHNNLTVVGLSRWLAGCASKSTLFQNNDIFCLPNPIDTSVYAPLDRCIAREILQLPEDKKLILFGGIGAANDPRKGHRELCEALVEFEFDDIELVVFGNSEPKVSEGFKFKTHYLGILHDDVTLRALYSAVDVMVVPSLQENLSNAVMESLACATPVVGFDVGGNSDMVEHQVNGYLAKPFDTVDLAAGIEWVLDAQNYTELSANARNKVLKEFDSVVVAKRYIALYESVLER